jgi:E3 ubiquitin-protein ligase HERC2
VDGREVELCADGKRKLLTLSTCGAFVRLMFSYHLHEFDAAASAISNGLGQLVPLPVLRLFTASQFELLVAGKAEVSEWGCLIPF